MRITGRGITSAGNTPAKCGFSRALYRVSAALSRQTSSLYFIRLSSDITGAIERCTRKKREWDPALIIFFPNLSMKRGGEPLLE
jgi:hypothetical protein